MKKFWHIVRHVLGSIAMVAAMCACWAAVYYMTEFVYQKFDMHLSDLVRQIITGLIGIFLLGAVVGIIGRIFKPKRMQVFQTLLDAIRRITKGDYNIDLNLNIDQDNPIKQLAQSINHMAVELGQMEQMRQEFISNVSHEIQSPLTSISGFARVLQNEQLGREERIHYLRIIETESMRLSKLSDNLLKLTSLESEHYPIEKRPFRLDKQLRSIVLSCEPQWMEKEIEMDISFGDTTMVADEDLLSQVWVNLLHNSIKFTPPGGTIGVHLEKCEQEVIVRISDNGIGIAQEELEHIFERFYKADKSRNHRNSGSGLGLSIVKKIVEMHQGRIDVASNPGEGTRFTVVLPLGTHL